MEDAMKRMFCWFYSWNSLQLFGKIGFLRLKIGKFPLKSISLNLHTSLNQTFVASPLYLYIFYLVIEWSRLIMDLNLLIWAFDIDDKNPKQNRHYQSVIESEMKSNSHLNG